MGTTKFRRIAPYLGALVLIMIAMMIRYGSRAFPDWPRYVGQIRSGIYISLFVLWGVSLGTRILQIQTRPVLTAIAGLMVLWLVLRSVKYVADSEDVRRYLWYFYYLPMLMIPTLFVAVAMNLGKPESYRLPKWMLLLHIPALVLLVLVLTNDVHQLVFRFPAGQLTDEEYSYGAGYYVVAAWSGLCAICALGMILYKCRIPHTNVFLWLPLLPFGLTVIYTVCYIRGVYWVWALAGDITVTMCVLIAATVESCIQSGLILSNQGYETLLDLTTIPTQITNENYEVRFASKTIRSLPPQILAKATANSYALDGHTLLKGHSVEGGYVFWQEDISKLVEVTVALQNTQGELRDTGDLLKAENDQRTRWLRITEQNRLYDLIEQQTSHQMQLLEELLEALRRTESLSQAKDTLGQIVVIGTYIKRRSNLIFVAGQRCTVAAEELRLCLNESAANLRLYGVDCQANLELEGQLSQDTAYAIYDLFEAVVEAALPKLSSLLLYAGFQEDRISLRLSVLGEGDYGQVCRRFPGVSLETDEDGIRYFTCDLEGGKPTWT